ncbi:MAG: O-antigen ligase family protein [Muribaculaceae bacterium]|nr:O-antigen ligase family protein [Muribaculaceae bacterium]
MKIFISVLIFIISFFSASSGDYLFLSGWLTTLVILIFLWNNDKTEWNYIDFILYLFIIYECFRAVWLKDYKAPTTSALGIWLSTGVYFTIKFSGQSSQRKIISCIYFILLGFVILSFPPFIDFITKIRELNLDNPIPYRYVISYFGMGVNQWASITLAISVISICGLLLINNISCRNPEILLLTILSTLSITASLLSFSRGIYIAISIMLALVTVDLVFFKSRIKINKTCTVISLTCPFVIVYFISPIGVTNVIIPHTDVSQARSLDGRLAGAINAYNIFTNHPVTGAGSGQFAMTSYMENNTTDHKTSFPGNSLSHMLAEKGISGSVMLISIFIFLILGVLTNKRISIRIKFIICSCIFVLCIREMTYPGIFNNTSQQTIWMFFLAYLSNYMDNKLVILDKQLKISGFSVAVIMCGIMSYQSYEINKRQDTKISDTSITENKNRHSLLPLFSKMTTDWTMYKSTKDIRHLESAFDNIKVCLVKKPNDPVFLYNAFVISKTFGKIQFADSVKQVLSKKHPSKLLSHWAELIDKLPGIIPTELIHRLASISISFPEIRNTEEYHNLITDYSIDEKEIKKTVGNKLSGLIQESDPINLSHNGVLAYWTENENMAEYFLNKSINKLPNLIVPHYLLSEIYKKKGLYDKAEKHEKIYRFLYRKDNTSGTIINKVSTLDDYYVSNFENWYGFRVAPHKIILN